MLNEENKSNFLSKINITLNENECWEWSKYKNRGYGALTIGGRTFIAHRLAYEILKGKIPDNLHLDHLCRNRACCNPNHLEPVTLAENNRRAKAHLTHCKRGHEFNEQNTRIRTDGSRECVKCRRERREGYNERDRQIRSKIKPNKNK